MRWSVLLAALLLQTPLSWRAGVVALPVRVTDAEGHVVTGLKPENFRILQDGKPQVVSMFHHGDAPVTLGIVVDHSQSMGPKLLPLIRAITAFARSGRPDDEMFAVAFNDQVRFGLPVDRPFTTDPAELETALEVSAAEGRTALYDAIVASLEHVRKGKWDRTALVIVSDGGDNASQHKYSDVRALAQQSQTVIYALGLVDAHGEDEDPDVLKRLCRDTGGLCYFPPPMAKLEDVLAQISRDLRDQYVVGFSPAPEQAPGEHKVEVTATSDGKSLHVRTRPGYVGAPKGTR